MLKKCHGIVCAVCKVTNQMFHDARFYMAMVFFGALLIFLILTY